jgi:hypothetical protein
MDDEIVTQTLDEMDGNLSGSLSSRISSMVASNMAGKEESRATSSADGGAILGGLSTSRFAAATAVVSDYLNNSHIYKSLPAEIATALCDKNWWQSSGTGTDASVGRSA